MLTRSADVRQQPGVRLACLRSSSCPVVKMSWLRWLSLRRHRMTYFFSTWFCSALSPEGSGFKLPREAWRSIMMSSCMGFTSIPSKYNYIGFPIAVLLLAWAEVMLPSSKLAFSFLHTGHVEGLVVHSQPLSHCLVRPCFLPSPDADLSMESSRCAVFCLLERRPSERLAPLYASRWHTVRLWHSNHFALQLSHYHRPRRLCSVTTLATRLAVFLAPLEGPPARFLLQTFTNSHLAAALIPKTLIVFLQRPNASPLPV